MVSTLRQVFADYLLSRRELKESTVKDYRKRLKCVNDWLDLPISSISKDQVEARHREISAYAPAQANSCFRVVRALLTYAGHKYQVDGTPVLKFNAVARLSEVRAWNKIRSRRGMVAAHQMPDWWRAVTGLRNKTVSDYLVTLMLTGLRRNEAATLRWADVNLSAGYLTVTNTKNGEILDLPLSDFLHALLVRRFQSRRRDNEYVFPGRVPGRPLSNCFKSFDRAFLACGFRFRLHDLRRTFLTNANAVRPRIDEFTIRRLANHKSQDDITALYIIHSHESLREPMQAVTDAILKQAGIVIDRTETGRA